MQEVVGSIPISSTSFLSERNADTVMMKILSGRARGRILNTGPQNPALRPILARVKKSIFDIIRPRIHGARFLDIFAGTGSVGLEGSFPCQD